MEFVIGNIYKFAYGNGGNNKGNPGEELGIGKFDHFIYDSSNRVTGLHFEDRYGPKIKCPTNCSYYDTYGIEYTEALNQDPIPQEVLDDYYRYFPQNAPKDLKIISNNEDTFNKGAISFNEFMKQCNFLNNLVNILHPKLKKEKEELEEEYDKLKRDYDELFDRFAELNSKFEKIKGIFNEV